MKLGISLPFYRPDRTAPTSQDIQRRAHAVEQAGFDGIFIGESIGRATVARPDVLHWLVAAAAATERVELGTAILEMPLRYPVEFAQRLMTTYALTGGRFVAGVGAGSTRADFDAVGVPYDERFRLFNEGLPVVKRLLNGETVGTANLHPWPNVRGRPPLLIGSWESGAWVKRAAREYDGWMGSGLTSFNAMRQGITRFRDAGGSRAMVMTVGVNLKAPREPQPDDQRPYRLYCPPDEAADRLARIASLGYDWVCLTSIDHTEADITDEDLAAIRSLVPVHS
ncbi:MAG TPA: LLM class flavin-dependent oxidoreductase [Chloroflexota bacterium]|nr:LLM class flavin-dependent oxidoreductase [Chloroflexota bacterium]